jgi:hypothetical protein
METSMKRQSKLVAWCLVALVCGAVARPGVHAQKATPEDAAARLSGTWKLNRELSPGFRTPGGRSGGPGRGGGAAASRFSAAPSYAPQGRGGGRGGDSPTTASDMSPMELAAMAAMRELQQLADVVTIDATADRVTFTDVRGERRYTLDGRSAKVTVAGAEVNTKSKWDRTALKQEFNTASTKLTHTWDVDGDGRLVLIAKVESLRLRTPDQKAIFDRK